MMMGWLLSAVHGLSHTQQGGQEMEQMFHHLSPLYLVRDTLRMVSRGL